MKLIERESLKKWADYLVDNRGGVCSESLREEIKDAMILAFEQGVTKGRELEMDKGICRATRKEIERVDICKDGHKVGPTGDIHSYYICFRCGKNVKDDCEHKNMCYSSGHYSYTKCNDCGKVW